MGYVLITGGNFKNKGAQSMVFTTVNEISKKFPQKEIIVISDADAVEYAGFGEKDQPFRFLIRDHVCLYGWIYKLVQRRYGKLDRYRDAAKIRKNIDMIIDISGYTFSSNFWWISNLLAAYRAKRARIYKVPIYYMPQSYGPFEWTGISGKITDICIRKWLPYAKVLYAREKEGARLLRERYGFSNVVLSDDLVLINKGIDLNNIYKSIPPVNFPDIRPNSVAVLPNVRNYKYGNTENLMQAYQTIIEILLAKNRTVYLIRHSTEDLDFCRAIKALYETNSNVVFLADDFSCWEYEMLIDRFDYLVASRYHAIIHAYRRHVPCIVLGWATKYKELLRKFEQENYAVDVRERIESEALADIVMQMEKEYIRNAKKIAAILNQLQSADIFLCVD